MPNFEGTYKNKNNLKLQWKNTNYFKSELRKSNDRNLIKTTENTKFLKKKVGFLI